MAKWDEINNWLISDGRQLGDGAAIINGYITRLVEAGIPLSRANIAQRFSNPLLVAWGVIWTPDGTAEYDVTHAMLDTDSYKGSAFEYVLANEKPLHKSLKNLDHKTEHSSYLEFAEAGGIDLFANYLGYGDGSKNGCTFITNELTGFSEEHIEIIQNTRHGLASAMEPVTMRRSTESLLRTYIGNDPGQAVIKGTIQRGEYAAVEAVVVITDLRGFTAKSEQWNDAELLSALNSYFDVVVQAIEDNGGDVLKFMGDGILSIFKIEGDVNSETQCRKAIMAAKAALNGLDELNDQRKAANKESLSMGIGINVGPVTYGNIGSPGRLDFTVLGPAVNVASRVQDLCKAIGKPVLATRQVAIHQNAEFNNEGMHAIRGVKDSIEVYSLSTWVVSNDVI
ncbi:MAG: adenylate/guanylate cyclase domain-containing protein [Pseudomonadota bacterium]